MMRRVSTADGVAIACYEYVTGAQTRGNVLFSHATGFHGRVFNTTINRMKNDFSCLSLDHRGHGQSGWNDTTRLSWNSLGEDTVQVSRAMLGDKKCIGVGHSMGGTAVVLAALKYPHLFQGLVLYEPVIFPPTWRAYMCVALLLGDSPLAKQCKRRRNSFATMDEAIQHFGSKPPMSIFEPAVLRDYVQYGITGEADGTPAGDVEVISDEGTGSSDSMRMRLCCNPEHEAVIYNTAHTHNTWRLLSELSVPVRLITGREEAGQVSSITKKIASAMGGAPKCEVIEWTDAGHFGPFQYPGRFAECIENFADDVK